MTMEEFLERFQNEPGYVEQLENTRVLRARWPRELEEDLRVMHGLDVEGVLGGILAEEIANEMHLEPITIPLIRRVMPRLVAGDIVGVQPMGVPTGLVFAMRQHPDEPEVKNIIMAEPPRDHFHDNEDLFRI